MALTTALRVPRATYRIQLTPQFTFASLAAQLPYLRSLGVSDLYLSPIFTAAPGSMHGYDVCDYTTVNEELGGRDGFTRLCAAARQAGLGFILDFVPNHMGITGPRNRWWRDVLEFGRDSPYAEFFDIQWFKGNPEGQPRVLLPLLGHHYGRELVEGKLALAYDQGFVVTYWEIQLPVSPASYAAILEPLAGTAPAGGKPSPLQALVTEFRSTPAAPAAGSSEAWRSRIDGLKRQLTGLLAADGALAGALQAHLAKLNTPPCTELGALLDAQSYRLARWKTGIHEINYRRFFAINTLVGLRMEDPAVFEAAHALLRELVRDPAVTGLRIDHVDGLRQPAAYLDRLQALAVKERGAPLYLLVEKILAPEEDLRAGWPVHGTTGYEFIPQLAAILVEPRAEPAFTQSYQRFTGELLPYAAVVVENKGLIMRELFADVIDVLAYDLASILAEDVRWRDFTRHELEKALFELMAQLGVYRTYADQAQPLAAPDREVVEQACAQAIRSNRRSDPQPLMFVRDLLIGVYPPAGAPAEQRLRIHQWILTWQQYTGAVMAKSVEDTSFYTYVRLVALNEVGGDPGTFGGTVASFHERNRRRAAQSPHALLTTSTHDTKLSEDVRARLYALSELAPEWEGWVAHWRQLTAAHTSIVAGQPAPDPLDQYRILQILLGAWPLALEDVNDTFRARLREHFRKAVQEAKRHSADLHANEPYLAACERYVDAILQPKAARDFLAEFVPAADRIARLGFVNSLVQVIVKLTSPGVPDIYQGCDLWDFSLVDPDNRRPVDFAHRAALQADAARRTPAELLHRWRDGGIKLWVMQRLLATRAAWPELFAGGSYEPLAADGTFAENVVAFMRAEGGRALVVIVPRLTATLGSPPVGSIWDATQFALPAAADAWRDVFTQREFPARETIFMRELFGVLPFCVLVTGGK